MPAAKAYRATTHKKQRKGIRNLLANARTPVTLVNDLLQGEFKRAGNTARQIFRSIQRLALAAWAIRRNALAFLSIRKILGRPLRFGGRRKVPYLFLPFFGPSSLRDGIGSAADRTLDPCVLAAERTQQNSPVTLAPAPRRFPCANRLLEPLDDIKANSLDYYASFRSFYLAVAQTRNRERPHEF